MDYSLKLDSFEGPLDLLWHLIKTNKMDILELKLELIIDQYLDYINEMERMNLDIASSYLVMASELIELKSKLLLPRLEEETEEEATNLVDRLIEYKKYKEITEELKDLETKRKDYYTKLPESLTEYLPEKEELNFGDIDLDDLVDAFKAFLEREKINQPIPRRVSRKELSVEDRIKELKTRFKTQKRIKFFDFFEVLTKEYVVVTFLAILEMAKEGEISIKQEDNFEEIYCEVLK